MTTSLQLGVYIYLYLVNKPLQAAGILEDNASCWEIVRKINICFEGKREILRTISQPGALSSNIPASRKGFIYFIILWLISSSVTCWERKKSKSKRWGHVWMCKLKHIDWLIFFIETVIRPGFDRLSCQMNYCNTP